MSVLNALHSDESALPLISVITPAFCEEKNPHVLCLGETNLWGCHGVAYHMPHAKLWGAEYPRALPAELPAGFFVIGKTPRWLAREKLKKNAAALQQWKALAKLLDNVAPVHTIGHSVDIYYLTPHKTLLSNQPQTHSRRIE
jgi:hypothetical protein